MVSTSISIYPTVGAVWWQSLHTFVLVVVHYSEVSATPVSEPSRRMSRLKIPSLVIYSLYTTPLDGDHSMSRALPTNVYLSGVTLDC